MESGDVALRLIETQPNKPALRWKVGCALAFDVWGATETKLKPRQILVSDWFYRKPRSLVFVVPAAAAAAAAATGNMGILTIDQRSGQVRSGVGSS